MLETVSESVGHWIMPLSNASHAQSRGGLTLADETSLSHAMRSIVQWHCTMAELASNDAGGLVQKREEKRSVSKLACFRSRRYRLMEIVPVLHRTGRPKIMGIFRPGVDRGPSIHMAADFRSPLEFK